MINLKILKQFVKNNHKEIIIIQIMKMINLKDLIYYYQVLVKDQKLVKVQLKINLIKIMIRKQLIINQLNKKKKIKNQLNNAQFVMKKKVI